MPTAFSSVGSESGQTLSLVPQASDATQVRTASRPPSLPTERSALQRVAEVRAQQGLSLRTMARRMNVEVKELRRQEEPTTDLTLSELRRWQKALDVPLVDLLEDESQSLSRPVNERAKMVRIMKTVV